MRGDGPTVLPVVALAPPAVQHAQVDDAVDARLLPGGAAGLHGVLRGVEPDVHAGDQLARQRQVVALHQHDAAGELRSPRELVDHLDEVLARQVVGVGLAGEDQQHRALGIVDQARQAFRIREQQGGPLVGGEAAGEADGEDIGLVGREMAGQALDDRLGHAVAPVLAHHPAPYLFQQGGFERLAQAPETVVRNFLDAVPVRLVEQLVAPLAAEAHVVQVDPVAGQEGGDVDAVGDMAHGVFLGRDLGPDVGLHLRCHPAVDATHPIVETGPVQRQRRLVETTLVARARAQGQELVHADTELVGEIGEVGADQAMIEDIVPGRYRRVGGEHRGRRHRLQRLVELEAIALDQFAAAFQHHERGMAFVDVPHRGGQAQGAQGPYPADAEDDLLLYPGDDVAPVELVGDGAVGLLVLRQVAVEEEHADVAGLGLPHLEHDPAPGQGDEDVDLLAIVQPCRTDGQVTEIGRRVMGDLVAVAVDGLGEIALAVEHAHRHEGDAQVAGRLAVVPRQDAQAAGIEWQALVQAELGAEVGDQVLVRIQVLLDTAAGLLAMIGVVGHQDAVVILQEDPVLQRGLQPLLGDAAQEHLGVVAAGLPQLPVQAVEQVAHLAIPGIEQVLGQLAQTFQAFRQPGLDFQFEPCACHAYSFAVQCR